MTTLIDFVPSTAAIPTHTVTLDGASYTLTVTWNTFGERYFINLYDLSGNLIVSRPLIGSPPKQSASFAWSLGSAIVTCDAPHGVPIGRLAQLTASDTSTGFDGVYPMLATSSTTLSYPLNENPEATPNGNIAANMNLVTGYFGSPLVYRSGTMQFEF